jgi:DNA-binding GntR family transcriptional regulator
MATQPYIELANRLRRYITGGVYGTEGGLPGAAELSKRHSLSEVTVRKALAILQGEKLIVSRERSFFVNKLSFTMTQYIPPVHIRRAQYTENLEPVQRIFLPKHIADKLQLSSDTKVVFRAQVSGEIDESGLEKPFKISRHYYLIAITDEQLQQMQDDPNYDVMWESTPERMACHDEQTPRLPTGEESEALGLSETTPISSLFITIRTTEGELLLVQELALAPRVTLIYEYVFENKPLQTT